MSTSTELQNKYFVLLYTDMKKDVHPKYFPAAKVTCVCGQVFSVGSTLEDFTVEICSACHPFYTGNEKILDTAGRVDKFKKRKVASDLKKAK